MGAYEAELAAAFTMLGEHPLIGRARDDLRPGCRSFPVGRHIIYYVARGQTVRIIRILHGRMDARRALGGSS